MSKKYRDIFDDNNASSNNRGNKSNNKSPSTFDMFSINVSKANKDTKNVFDFAKSQLFGFEKSSAKSAKNVTDTYISSYKQMYSNLSKQHRAFLDNYIRQEQAAASRVSQIWNSVNRNGSVSNVSSNFYGSSNSYNNEDISDSISSAADNMIQASDSISESNDNTSASVSKSASVMSAAVQIGVDAIKTYLNKWINRFFDGMDRIVDTYENSYQTVSVLMDVNQGQYIDMQSGFVDKINDMGLHNNLAVSTVMKELETVVRNGVVDRQATNKALSDSVTKVLNPYLETTTDAYTDLQLKLGDDFVKTMQGMAEANRQTAGSNRFMSKNINDILTQMEPIVLNAKSDYADKILGPMVQQLEGLVSSGTLTEAEAEKLKQSALDMTLNPYEALTSGTVTQRVAMNSVISNGEDTTNSYNNLIRLLESESSLFSGVKSGTLDASVVSSIYGSSLSYTTNRDELIKSIKEINKNTKSSYKASEALNRNFSNDKYNTMNDQHNLAAENTSEFLARLKETYPDTFDVLSSIAGSLLKIASGAVLQKVGSSLLRSFLGRGSTGFGSRIFNSFMGRGGFGGFGGSAGAGGTGAGVNAFGEPLLTTGTGAGGTGLAGTGLSAGYAAGAAGSALVAVGGAVETVDGIKRISEDRSWKTDKEKTANAVQIGAGATAAIAGGVGAGLLLASNPVGWAVAAVGAVALGVGFAAKCYADAVDETTAVTKEVTSAFEAQKEQLKSLQDQENNNLSNEKEYIEQLSSLEEKKKYVIESGIFSKEEVANLTEKGFNNLFEEYSKSEKEYLDKKHALENKYLEEGKKKSEEAAQEASYSNEQELIAQMKKMSKEDAIQIMKNIGVHQDDIDAYKNGTWTLEQALTGKGTGWFGTDWLFNSENYLRDMNSEDWEAVIGSKGLKSSKFKQPKMSADEFSSKYAEYARLKALVDAGAGNTEADKQAWKQANQDFYNKFPDGKPPSMYATGISYVPEDQLAKIHKGETVLNKYDAKSYREAKSTISSLGSFLNSTINNIDNLNSKIIGKPTITDDDRILDIINEMNENSYKTDDNDTDNDSTRSDIVTAINEGVTRLLRALGIDDKNLPTLLNRRSNSYDSNLENLSVSTSTRK